MIVNKVHAFWPAYSVSLPFLSAKSFPPQTPAYPIPPPQPPPPPRPPGGVAVPASGELGDYGVFNNARRALMAINVPGRDRMYEERYSRLPLLNPLAF